jgi:hypothetical protein
MVSRLPRINKNKARKNKYLPMLMICEVAFSFRKDE